MGFHFRGWFGAWMAGEGGSAASRARQPWQWWLGALGARRGAGLGFYRRMGVTGAGFLRLGGNAGLGECRTGAARTGGSGGRPWRRGNTGRVGARGDLRERQGSLISAIQGALEGGLGRATMRGAARWLRRRTALPVGRAQGGERLKKRSVAIS